MTTKRATKNAALRKVFTNNFCSKHYNDVIMTMMASQITSLTIVYSTIYSNADQRKHQKLCVTGLCAGNSLGPVNSPHKGPVTRKMFPLDDVIMESSICRQHIFKKMYFVTHWTHGKFGEILIKMQIFWLKQMHLKMSSTKWRPFCLGHISMITFCISSEIRFNATR